MGLVALGGGAMMADQIAARGAPHVATQRIRVDEIGTIRPAALSPDGRLIAFVSGNPESSQGYCCQAVRARPINRDDHAGKHQP